MQTRFFNRDISWLSFNQRILLEAADQTVPIGVRLKFLSIYSSNLDEFYRIRIPALLSLRKMEAGESLSNFQTLLAEISRIVSAQMKELGAVIEEKMIPVLKSRKIHLVYNEPIPDFLRQEVTEYFFNQVAGFLHPHLLSEQTKNPVIENNKLHLLVVLKDETGAEQIALVNIPEENIPRFFYTDVPPFAFRYILFLDDIIKENLSYLFPGRQIAGSYAFKITRDAELDLKDEFDGDIAEKIARLLKKRDSGLATRLLYQPGVPLRTLQALIACLRLNGARAIPGGRYHNLKDFLHFPLPVTENPVANPLKPIVVKDLIPTASIFDTLAINDIAIHTPYQSFFPVIRFFNEAAIDSRVEEIYLTIYRVAHDSIIANALLNAAMGGKKITVFVELKARFDEENNLEWAAKLKAAGVKIIYSIPGFKVHAKIALVKRRENNRLNYYGLLSSGNFNEGTAQYYTDHVLMTSHKDIVSELEKLFIFLSLRIQPGDCRDLSFKQLLVAQFNLKSRFLQLIEQEIDGAKNGKQSGITIKLNGLEDQVLISKLYEASNAGVPIKLIVRGICCLVPGVPNQSENITVLRIVDSYLEHGRVFIFNNDDHPLLFVGSSDWMTKNIVRRIEVCFPVYDQSVRQQLLQLIRIQLSDNEKAVTIDGQQQNIRIKPGIDQASVRSQDAIYELLKSDG